MHTKFYVFFQYITIHFAFIIFLHNNLELSFSFDTKRLRVKIVISFSWFSISANSVSYNVSWNIFKKKRKGIKFTSKKFESLKSYEYILKTCHLRSHLKEFNKQCYHFLKISLSHLKLRWNVLFENLITEILRLKKLLTFLIDTYLNLVVLCSSIPKATSFHFRTVLILKGFYADVYLLNGAVFHSRSCILNLLFGFPRWTTNKRSVN